MTRLEVTSWKSDSPRPDCIISSGESAGAVGTCSLGLLLLRDALASEVG
jgi:hypothetical protein